MSDGRHPVDRWTRATPAAHATGPKPQRVSAHRQIWFPTCSSSTMSPGPGSVRPSSTRMVSPFRTVGAIPALPPTRSSTSIRRSSVLPKSTAAVPPTARGNRTPAPASRAHRRLADRRDAGRSARASSTAWPHDVQNRSVADVSAPQRLQNIGTRPPRARSSTVDPWTPSTCFSSVRLSSASGSDSPRPEMGCGSCVTARLASARPRPPIRAQDANRRT